MDLAVVNAFVREERRRRHEAVDRDCDAMLVRLSNLITRPAGKPVGFRTLQQAAGDLDVSERSVVRLVAKYKAGTKNGQGRWQVDVSAIRRSQAIELADHAGKNADRAGCNLPDARA